MGSDINDALERISKTNEAQMVQQMFAMMTDKCFLKCIEKPGSQLSRSDKVAVAPPSAAPPFGN